jgi:glutathione synthase/RimK-type ligase-like ATP-grasp enzyme
MKTKMLLYNNGSRTGRAIASMLNLTYNRNCIDSYNCINWGSGVDRKVKRLPNKWLNKRECVDIAKDKLKTFNVLNGKVNIPEYTTSYHKAKEWVSNGDVVYCRTLLRANQGRGIIVARSPSEVVYCKLYTKQVKYDYEYRVHIFKGKVIGISKKIPKDEYSNTDVRNHHKGWRFSLRDIDRVHENIKNTAIKAVNEVGLDFSAVDLAWDKEQQKATIFEVNTAIGMDDGTIMYEYISNFKNWINGGI